MNIIPFIITILGGLLVLLSYYLVFSRSKQGYINSKYWLGQKKTIVTILICFQILSVIGFFLFMASPNGWLFGDAPSGGVLGNRIVFSTVLTVFLLASASWAFLAKKGLDGSRTSAALCSLSLVVSAICAILFIAGSVEEENPRWNVVLGTILFGITIILSDGIAWNAKFLKSTVFK